MSDTELAVLKSQLQGIMECSDFISLFCLLDHSKLTKIHMNRMNKLICLYNKTNSYFIKKYNEIPYFSANFEKLIQSNLKLEKDSELEWITKMIFSWERWAETSIELYEKLYSKDSDNRKWWGHLYKLHKSDLNLSRFFKKKLIPEGYEIPQTTKQKLQAKMNPQKSINETE